MRVLLDNNVNQRFARLLTGHEVVHSRKMGWEERYNGTLIQAAEDEGFSVVITADKQMRYQQNVSRWKISIIVLNSWRITWRQIQPLGTKVQAILDGPLASGSFIVVDP